MATPFRPIPLFRRTNPNTCPPLRGDCDVRLLMLQLTTAWHCMACRVIPILLLIVLLQQDSVIGEGRDMDAGEVKSLAQGVAAIDMGL